MDNKILKATVKRLMEDGKGILALDESPGSLQKKFDKHGICNTVENRRRFRNMLIETEGLEKYISGVILHMETFEQMNDDGMFFVNSLLKRGIIPGIKLDLGLRAMEYSDISIKMKKEMQEIGKQIPEDVKEQVNEARLKVLDFLKANSTFVRDLINDNDGEGSKESKSGEDGKTANVAEKETEKDAESKDNKAKKEEKAIKSPSLGNLDKDIEEKVTNGIERVEKVLATGMFSKAGFSKWRAIFFISSKTPTSENVDVNVTILTKFAQICQLFNIVPILEVEVIYEGGFSIDEHYKVISYILSILMHRLICYDVDPACVLIKMGFITDGEAKQIVDIAKTVNYMDKVFSSIIPFSLPGIVFLSGGHSYKNSLDYLTAICKHIKYVNLSFSFCRAITDDALDEYGNGVEQARRALLRNCKSFAEASKQHVQ